MRLSCHTAILHELPVLTAVDTLITAGYDAVELNAETLPWAQPHVGPTTTADIRAALRRRGTIGSIAAHRPNLAHPDPALRAQALTWTKGCIELAHDIGVPIIHVIPGDHPDIAEKTNTTTTPGDLSAFITSLTEIIKRANELHITVAVEPIVNQLIATTDQALHLLHQIPDLTISFDPSHLHVTTGDVTDAARRLGTHISIVALKDATGTPENFTFPPLNTGDIDFITMLNQLHTDGFTGDLVIEHEAHLFGDSRDPHTIIHTNLTTARHYLHHINTTSKP